VSWISGPCNDEPERDDEQEGPRNLEPRWDVEMAESQSHWVRLNQRRYPDRAEGSARD
jgi:hypothetical protein